MATVARDFTYFDRTFSKGDELDDTDPAVRLMPQMFERKRKSTKKKAAKPATPDKKERP